MNILKSIKYTNAKRSPTLKLKKKGQAMNNDFERNSSFDENVGKKENTDGCFFLINWSNMNKVVSIFYFKFLWSLRCQTRC